MKRFINKILDMPKLILRLWILLWVILAILLVFKFCFGIWYPIVVKNETFISICNYIDNHKALSLSLMCVFYVISGNIICLTYIGRKIHIKWYINLIYVLGITGMYFLKNINAIFGIICELILIIIAIAVNVKMKTFRTKLIDVLLPIIFYILVNVWQLTMLVVRDENGVLSNLPTLIGIIVQLDYYIFIIISWIGVSFMGLWS